MKKRRRFTAEKKAQIVLEVLREDSTLAEVANEYGLHQAQLSKWKQEFLLNMPMIFKKKEKQVEKLKKSHEQEKEELVKEIGQLTVEVNWLKKIWSAIKAFPKEKGYSKRITLTSRSNGSVSCYQSPAAVVADAIRTIGGVHFQAP